MKGIRIAALCNVGQKSLKIGCSPHWFLASTALIERLQRDDHSAGSKRRRSEFLSSVWEKLGVELSIADEAVLGFPLIEIFPARLRLGQVLHEPVKQDYSCGFGKAYMRRIVSTVR
jgi:hypothetical protein